MEAVAQAQRTHSTLFFVVPQMEYRTRPTSAKVPASSSSADAEVVPMPVTRAASLQRYLANLFPRPRDCGGPRLMY